MTKIVCDAGPIIHLQEAKLLHLIEPIGDVIVPYQVKIEVEALVDFKTWPKWLRVQDIPLNRQREASMLCRSGDLQLGEAQAIILSRILDADWLLTDDLAARVFAKSLGIEVHGSLGIVLWNVAHDRISAKQGGKALRALAETSLWLSPGIIAEALAAIEELS